MKSLYVISLFACVIFGATLIYFIQEASSLRWQQWNEWDYGNYMGDAYYELKDLSMLGGGICLLFTTFFILLFSFTIKHIKRTTAKVMSIIGLSFSGISFLVCLLPVSDPGGASFDEFALAPLIYDVIMLAFCIVNLVQAFSGESQARVNEQVIDDLV